MVEEGRFRGIERNLRICSLCPMNIMEDEYHFLLVCPTYRELRKIIYLNLIADGPPRTNLLNY